MGQLSVDHSIGRLIAVLRREKGLTQVELAEMLNMSDKAVSKWESEKGNPDISQLPLLAEIFDVTIDYIMTGDIAKDKDRCVSCELECVTDCCGIDEQDVASDSGARGDNISNDRVDVDSGACNASGDVLKNIDTDNTYLAENISNASGDNITFCSPNTDGVAISDDERDRAEEKTKMIKKMKMKAAYTKKINEADAIIASRKKLVGNAKFACVVFIFVAIISSIVYMFTCDYNQNRSGVTY